MTDKNILTKIFSGQLLVLAKGLEAKIQEDKHFTIIDCSISMELHTFSIFRLGQIKENHHVNRS